ncbi:carboxypeptidase-like regulatory domain-containing protein [Arcticibacter tournemirensis]
MEEEQSDVWFNNCAGYTLNYTNKVSEERDSITIYGIVKFCSSNKAIQGAEISFYGNSDSVMFHTKTDAKGYYEIKVSRGYYCRIQADSWGGGLTIPDVDLGVVGDAGGAMNIDIKLLRRYLLINYFPLTRKDIRQIKKNRKKNKN